MTLLSEYLGEFAIGDFEATANPVQSGLVRRKVSDLQNILIKLGWRATTIPRPGAKDFGLYGPKTAGAWASSSNSRKLNPTFQRASSTEAYVDPKTLAILSGTQQTAPAAAAPAAVVRAPTAAKPTAAPATILPTRTASGAPSLTAGMTQVSAKTAHDLLYALGWTTKKLPKNAVYTPALAKAWGISATTRKLSPTLKNYDGGTVVVEPATLAAIQAEVQKKTVVKGAPAAEKAAATVAPGYVIKPVLHLQELLYGVGWTAKKLKKDGKFGPQTQKAWGVSAKLRKLPTTFTRVDGKTAKVSQATYDRIAADAAKTGVAPSPTPTPTPSKPTPVADKVPATDTVNKSVADVQNVLIKLGWKSSTIPRPGARDFGLYGPKTKSAWQSSTKTRGLNTMFDRVDGKTVRVSTKSYIALLKETSKKKPAAPKPAPVSEPDKPIGGETSTPILPIVTAYQILYDLGWTTKKLPKSSKFTKALANAWAVSAKTRKLNPSIKQYKTDMIVAHPPTIVKLSADAAENRAKAGKAPAPAQPAPSPAAGRVTITAAEMQSIVHLLGEPKTKATTDKKFGPSTQKAWEKVALARKLNAGVTGKTGATKVQVVAETYKTLKAETQKKPAPKPSPLDTVKIMVDTVQTSLNVLTKSKLKVDGTWGKNTENALRSWLNKQPGGKGVKISIVSKAKNKSAIKLPSGFVSILQNAAKAAPAPAPKDTKDKALVDAILKRATVSVPVLSVQRTIEVARRVKPSIPAVQLTGTWDPATTEAFLAFNVEQEALRPGFRMAIPKLVSPDNRTIRVFPEMEAAIVTGAKLWAERPAPAPTPSGGGQPYDLPAPPEPAPSPRPAPAPDSGPSPQIPTAPDYSIPEGDEFPGGGGGGGVPGGGEAGAETPGGGAVPAPPSGTPVSPEAVWNNTYSALKSFITEGPKIIEAFEAAQATGGTISPEAEEAYTNWLQAAERLKQRVAQVLEQPQVANALNAVGGAQQTQDTAVAGYYSLEAYLGELSSVASELIDTLKAPLIPGVALAPVAGPVEGLGIIGPALGWAGRLAGPAWAKLIELLGLPVVRSAVVTTLGWAGLNNILNADVQAYADANAVIAQLVAEGKLTVEQAERLKEKKPMGAGPLIALSVVALGGLALYLRNKRP